MRGQSENTRWTGNITRQRNKRIRWFLTEAAQTAARFDPKMKLPIKEFQERRPSKIIDSGS